MTDTAYHFKKLTAADIADFLDLQDKIIPASIIDGVCRIKPRDAAYMAGHIASMPAVGYVDKLTGELVASALVTYPDHPLARYMEAYPFAEKLSDIFVVQGLYVSPAHQKKGLSCKLVTQAFNMAAPDGRYIGYAKTGSLSGVKSFAKCGFAQVAGGADPFFGYDVAYMRKQEQVLPQTALALPEPSQFRYI